jgi:hypothetical protein
VPCPLITAAAVKSLDERLGCELIGEIRTEAALGVAVDGVEVALEDELEHLRLVHGAEDDLGV